MRKFTNRQDLRLSVAAWLAYDEYEYATDPRVISATSLLNPVRSIVLSRQHKSLVKETDVADLIPARMGSAYHSGIENTWTSPDINKLLSQIGIAEHVADKVIVNPTNESAYQGMIPVYVEQRYQKEIDGYIISGQMDFCFNGTLEDFKSMSVYGYIFDSNTEKFIEQASIYRWLAPTVVTNDIFYLTSLFTDWSSVKAIQDKSYPSQRIISQAYPLLTLQETEALIGRILCEIRRYQDSPQEDLPRCNRKELWQKDDVWKYYKNPEKKDRSTKNFPSEGEASQRYTQDGCVGEIVFQPGQAKRCIYCSVLPICDQAAEMIHSGQLVINQYTSIP